jgi:hypothetical protein
MAKLLEYIPEEKNTNGEWVKKDVMRWRLLEEEMAMVYAANCVRITHLGDAENNLKDYRHPEPLRIAGKTKMVEIHNAVGILEKPFCLGMKASSGTKQGHRELSHILGSNRTLETSKEMGLQSIASIGWLLDVTKARPPEITQDTSSVDYEENLLPGNLEVKEESAPSGYNNAQMELLQEAKTIMVDVLKGCGELSSHYEKMGIVVFGNKVFKTYAKVFSCLPDPEEEERERFNAMRDEAKAKEAEDDD